MKHPPRARTSIRDRPITFARRAAERNLKPVPGYLQKTEPVTPPKHTNGKEPKNFPYLIWSGLTLVTCPCCIPLWIILLSGTAAGALLSRNLYVTVAVFLVLFLFSGWRALRTYNPDKTPH